EPQAPWME
nr:Chain P, H-2 class I histocompatibility antigen, L-D alpha chain3V52_P Chain P, H-2 class I histocompatibility antigen, L-D alpha chain [Mus musculus]